MDADENCESSSSRKRPKLQDSVKTPPEQLDPDDNYESSTSRKRPKLQDSAKSPPQQLDPFEMLPDELMLKIIMMASVTIKTMVTKKRKKRRKKQVVNHVFVLDVISQGQHLPMPR